MTREHAVAIFSLIGFAIGTITLLGGLAMRRSSWVITGVGILGGSGYVALRLH